MRLYLNGQLVGSHQLAAPPINNTSPFSLGMIPSNATATRFFTGLMDDLKVYNRHLSESEITSLYELRE